MSKRTPGSEPSQRNRKQEIAESYEKTQRLLSSVDNARRECQKDSPAGIAALTEMVSVMEDCGNQILKASSTYYDLPAGIQHVGFRVCQTTSELAVRAAYRIWWMAQLAASTTISREEGALLREEAEIVHRVAKRSGMPDHRSAEFTTVATRRFPAYRFASSFREWFEPAWGIVNAMLRRLPKWDVSAWEAVIREEYSLAIQSDVMHGGKATPAVFMEEFADACHMLPLNWAYMSYADRLEEIEKDAPTARARLRFDDLSHTVYLDGTPIKVEDPKAYFIYKVIASQQGGGIIKSEIQNKVPGTDGLKTIPSCMEKLPARLRATVQTNTSVGYFIDLQ